MTTDAEKLLDCIKNFLSSADKNRIEYVELLTFGFESDILLSLLTELEQNNKIEFDHHYVNSAIYLKE